MAGRLPQERRLSHSPSPQEMASDELKEIRKAMTKEAIREHQMARTGGTQTDLFTCGKCRKKSCTYTQVRLPAAPGRTLGCTRTYTCPISGPASTACLGLCGVAVPELGSEPLGP